MLRQVVVAAAALVAGWPPGQPASDAPPTLVKVVSRDEDDKGSVPLGAAVGRRIVVRNVWDRPVRLTVASKSCECMDPMADPPTIEPGQTSVLTFQVAAVGTADQQEYTTVFKASADAGDGKTLTQRIVARVRYTTEFEFVVKPRRVDATAVQGCPFEAPIYLQFVARDRFSPAEPALPWPGLMLEPDPQPTLEGENAVWILRLRGTAMEGGLLRGILSFQVRGARDSRVEIPAAVHVQDRWQAVPPGVVWRAGTGDSPSVTVRLRDRCPTSTVGRPSHACLEPRMPGVRWLLLHDDGAATVRIEVDPAAVRPPGVGTLLLRDDADRIVGRVPIVLYAQAAASPTPASAAP